MTEYEKKLLELARLVVSAAESRADKDYELMHLDLSEAAEIARAVLSGHAREKQ